MMARERVQQWLLAGVAAIAIGLHAWLATSFGELRAFYADLPADLPVATRLVLSPVWCWGVPVAGAIMLAVVVALRPRSRLPYALLAIIVLAALAITHHYAWAPLHELSAKLRSLQ